jgi:anti-sigma regulatory factor (Ser/Thr protein kinase)
MESVVGQSTSAVERGTDRFRHEVAFYSGQDDLGRAVLPFIREGVALREPVLVAMVPEKLAILERALGADSVRVDFVDMGELGANPACIIPEWRRFLEDTRDSGPVRGVGEPAWPGRREVELDEAALHESLLNVAFDDGPGWSLLCPYDTSALPIAVAVEAMRSHPVVHSGAREVRYGGHAHALERFTSSLPDVPSHALTYRFVGHDIALVRRRVRDACREQNLTPARADDLMLAAHELATNSVVHGGGHGELAIWREPGALVVEVSDSGRIDDPLVGRGLLDLESENGRGIWMANQLCELVQVRSGTRGTQVRLWAWG